MAGAGYRTFQSGEVLTSTNVQTYLMDQAVQVYSGTAARASAIPSPSTGMVAYSTATGLQVFNGSAWTDVGGVGYGAATGGQSTATATISGVDYTILTFTATGTLTNTKAGFFDYLLIGGGSGAASWVSGGNGGGGCGQVLIGSVYLSANQTITIGAGSSTAAFSTTRTAGNTSLAATSPFTVTAGGAINLNSANDGTAFNGFGGGGGNISVAAVVTVDTIAGFKGGGAVSAAGGGGGGFTSAATAGSGTTGGNGGNGYDISAFIGGSAAYRATGGGGGGSVTGGAGGNSSANNNAGTSTTAGNNATANTGSGGGAGYTGTTNGNGGSGVAYIRFRT